MNLRIETLTLYVKQNCVVDFTLCNLLSTPRFCAVVVTETVTSVTRLSLKNCKLVRGWGLGKRLHPVLFFSFATLVPVIFPFLTLVIKLMFISYSLSLSPTHRHPKQASDNSELEYDC